MTPHQTMNFLEDNTSAIRIYPGGPWKVDEMNGHTDGSMAQRFCDYQNRFILNWHRGSVTRVRNGGRP